MSIQTLTLMLLVYYPSIIDDRNRFLVLSAGADMPKGAVLVSGENSLVYHMLNSL